MHEYGAANSGCHRLLADAMFPLRKPPERRLQPEFRLLKNGLGMLTNALSLRRMQEWVGGEKAF
jgi:hypothetical protein